MVFKMAEQGYGLMKNLINKIKDGFPQKVDTLKQSLTLDNLTSGCAQVGESLKNFNLKHSFRKADIALHRYFIERPADAQFYTFESGNLAVALKDGDIGGLFKELRPESLLEDISAISFVAGSTFAKFKEKHPGYFTTGMTLMALGGTALAASGATGVGIAVAWASLDAARGGYFDLENQITEGTRQAGGWDHKGMKAFKLATDFIDLPTHAVEKIEQTAQKRFPTIAAKIEPATDAWKRPLTRQLMVKGPTRVAFVFASATAGDLGGVLAGSLWLGGDISLAHMDPVIKESQQQHLDRKIKTAEEDGLVLD